MSAESFHVCFGLRMEVPASDRETVASLESRTHSWLLAAKRQRLQSWWGLTADERTYFVLVGRFVGHFGSECDAVMERTGGEMAELVADATQRLAQTGLPGQPAWHFQHEPDC